jgi:hypothetical protein
MQIHKVSFDPIHFTLTHQRQTSAPMIDKVELAFAQQLKALFALCAAARGLGVERGASFSGRRELGALVGDARRRLLSAGRVDCGGGEREGTRGR